MIRKLIAAPFYFIGAFSLVVWSLITVGLDRTQDRMDTLIKHFTKDTE